MNSSSLTSLLNPKKKFLPQNVLYFPEKSNFSNEKTFSLPFERTHNLARTTYLVCKKVSQKPHALGRVSKFISKKKLRVITKAFITSQFSYCPLVWICHSKALYNKINKLHERALRLISDDWQSTFEEIHRQISYYCIKYIMD